MKKLVVVPLLVVVSLLFFNAKNTFDPAQTDMGDCLAKFKSAWGESTSRCSGADTYKVWLKNTCTSSIDVLVCVQEADKTWRPFSHNGMAPNDSMVAYACEGTGKYLYWARNAGDDTVIFPTVDQINKKYNE